MRQDRRAEQLARWRAAKGVEARSRVAYDLYCEYGTLAAVAEVARVTRERVRQLLAYGEHRGLFPRVGRRNGASMVRRAARPPNMKEVTMLRAAMSACEWNVDRAARLVGVTGPTVRKLLRDAGIGKAELKRNAEAVVRGRLAAALALLRVLNRGGRPSTCDMKNTRAGVWLVNTASRMFGGVRSAESELLPAYGETFE